MVRPERFELPTYSSGRNLEPLGQRGISELQRAQWAGKRHYRLQLNTFCTQRGVTEPGEHDYGCSSGRSGSRTGVARDSRTICGGKSSSWTPGAAGCFSWGSDREGRGPGSEDLIARNRASSPVGASNPGRPPQIAYNYIVTIEKDFSKYRNTTNQEPGLFDGSTFWTYDDPGSIRFKVDYAKTRDLGGAMVWELSSDTANRTLLKTISHALTQKDR